MSHHDPAVDILALVAHPDDAELICGGTLRRAADQGYRTGVLDLTGGEAGSWGTPGTRSAEAERASAILGLHTRMNAGLPDSRLQNDPESRERVAALLRILRPRVLILHWHQGRHPDHTVASALGYDAAFIAGLRNAGIDGEPHRSLKIIYAQAYREEPVKPSFVVDITDQIDAKIDAIFAFHSQFAEKTAMGEIFGGGTRPLDDQIRAHAAHYGSLIRKPYGEPFWVRETIAVNDLMELEVNSI